MMLNQKSVNITITRKDLCDLMLACTNAKICANDGGKKWEQLRNILKEQLNAFDEKEGF